MKFVAGLFGVSMLFLAGCAANRYCLGDQPYNGADDLPPLQPIEGLALPSSPTALRIPPAKPNPIPFGVADKEGKGVCLDKPPTMIEPSKAAASN